MTAMKVRKLMKKLRRLRHGKVSVDASKKIQIRRIFKEIPLPVVLNRIEQRVSRVIRRKSIRVSITGEGPGGYTYEDNMPPVGKDE